MCFNKNTDIHVEIYIVGLQEFSVNCARIRINQWEKIGASTVASQKKTKVIE